jgi:hypothetical protein
MARSVSPKLFGLALVAVLSAGTAFAQYGYPPQQPGYDYRYDGPAHETAERARSFGYHDGLAEGERDRRTGHSFRPTHSDRYEDAPDHGDHYGMSRGEFKSIYREAYLRGYQRGYGSY